MVQQYNGKKFQCPNCNKTATSKLSFCPGCKKMIEYVAVTTGESLRLATKGKKDATHTKPRGVGRSEVTHLGKIEFGDDSRFSTGNGELDRVLGGGMTTDSIIALTGSPGIGKSSLLMKVAADMAETRKVLYISGEESPRGLRSRSDRLGITGDGVNSDGLKLFVVFEADMEILLGQHIPSVNPDVIIVDSINTLYSSEIDGAPGNEKQLMYAAHQFQQYAKNRDVAVIMVAQVTKEGTMAGTQKLAHMVDAVLYLTGDNNHVFRLLRCEKNRMGNVQEVGVLRMESRGLIEVPNPSEAFLAERQVDNPGSAVAVTMEGERPILVEIQALVNPGSGGNPARMTYGFDRNRAFIITSVMDRHLPYVDLSQQDLVLNVVGGMRISENAADLPTVMAIISSHHNVPAPAEWVAIGEIGLTGEIRSVPFLEFRLREASKMGFTHAVVPTLREGISLPKKLKLHQVMTVNEAVRAMFAGRIDFSLFDNN